MVDNQIEVKDPLFKANDIAKILNISRAFAYRLMQQGNIRTVKISKARRVRQTDLEDFIENHLSPECNFPIKK